MVKAMIIIKRFLKKGFRYIYKFANKLRKIYMKSINKEEIDMLVKQINEINQKTILFLDIVDWNIPLFQRPQHIANNLAKLGYTYIFFSSNMYDNIEIYEKKAKNLYVVNNLYLKRIIDSVKVELKYIHLYSTDMKTSNHDIDKFIRKGYRLLYEYIDEISEKLYGSAIPKKAIKKHERILIDTDISIICTARKLYNESIKKRGNINIELVTNGVEYDHFSNISGVCPIKNIVEKNKPIIGYFGAFASWFDYEMINFLAREKKEYEILLIGWDYDGSIEKSTLKEFDNITILGPINYKILPQYANYFTVSIIPFLINEITESTSPIKLFEYMALGHPIVTTDMPECRLYSSVLVSKDRIEFVKNIEKAIGMSNNKKYLNKLREDALKNTWDFKAKEISALLK